MQEQDFTIFISHAAVDEEIARSIKDYIGRAFPSQRVFVSSDPQDLKPGDEWVAKILKALENAKCVLALATERGLSRKWVWFETGRTWYSGVILLPCCIGGVRKSNLPSPFSERMSLNIDEPQDVTSLFGSLRGQFGEMKEPPNSEQFAREMTRLDIRAEERSRVINDPYAKEIMTGIDRIMKTLSSAEQETIKQFAIYGELSTAGVRQLVKASGANMERWSVPSSLVDRTGWLISKSGNRPYDDFQQNFYSLNPTVVAHLRAYFARDTTSFSH